MEAQILACKDWITSCKKDVRSLLAHGAVSKLAGAVWQDPQVAISRFIASAISSSVSSTNSNTFAPSPHAAMF
jgi:hypothetical protein